MALSFVQYTGNGSQETYAIPFPYLQRENVEVRVDLDVTAYTWDDDNTIRISPAPADGAVIEARRITPRENRLVDFVDGAVLNESDLDLANLQTFYIVQEAIDIAGGTLELLSNGSYGAGGRRIEELGNPVENRDAVTKEWAETAMSSQLAQATAEKALAVAARTAAEAARDAAAGSASAAAGSASTASTQAGLADSSRAAAVSARDAALAYRDAAFGYRNEAQGFRNEAETFKNQAAASAAAAATFDPANYYQKTVVYTKTEVDNLDAAKLSHTGGTQRLSFGGVTGGWTTAGWQVPIQLRQGQAVQWLSNGASAAGGIGFSGNVFYTMTGPDSISGAGAPGYGLQINHSTGASSLFGNPIITTANFTTYFSMRKVLYGQGGGTSDSFWTDGNYPGPSGCFLTTINIFSDSNLHYGYYAYIQWYWNGGWYTAA